MLKALILNGTFTSNDFIKELIGTSIEELRKHGYAADHVVLREMKIGYCRGCFGCWIRSPGVCVIDDDGREIARRIIQSDLVVYITPVTFGGYSSELKKALDRTIGLVSPMFRKIHGEIHHRMRYSRYPALAAIGILDKHDGNQENIFKTLVTRNAINYFSPAHGAEVITHDESRDMIRSILKQLFSVFEVHHE